MTYIARNQAEMDTLTRAVLDPDVPVRLAPTVPGTSFVLRRPLPNRIEVRDGAVLGGDISALWLEVDGGAVRGSVGTPYRVTMTSGAAELPISVPVTATGGYLTALHDLTSQRWEISGDAHVTARHGRIKASGDARIKAGGTTYVHAEGNVTVEADGVASVALFGDSSAVLQGKATARVYQRADATLTGQATAAVLSPEGLVRAEGESVVTLGSLADPRHVTAVGGSARVCPDKNGDDRELALDEVLEAIEHDASSVPLDGWLAAISGAVRHSTRRSRGNREAREAVEFTRAALLSETISDGMGGDQYLPDTPDTPLPAQTWPLTETVVGLPYRRGAAQPDGSGPHETLVSVRHAPSGDVTTLRTFDWEDSRWGRALPVATGDGAALHRELLVLNPGDRRPSTAAAAAYGRSVGACLMCGRALSGQASLARGYGNGCAKKLR